MLPGELGRVLGGEDHGEPHEGRVALLIGRDDHLLEPALLHAHVARGPRRVRTGRDVEAVDRRRRGGAASARRAPARRRARPGSARGSDWACACRRGRRARRRWRRPARRWTRRRGRASSRCSSRPSSCLSSRSVRGRGQPAPPRTSPARRGRGGHGGVPGHAAWHGGSDEPRETFERARSGLRGQRQTSKVAEECHTLRYFRVSSRVGISVSASPTTEIAPIASSPSPQSTHATRLEFGLSSR